MKKYMSWCEQNNNISHESVICTCNKNTCMNMNIVKKIHVCACKSLMVKALHVRRKHYE